MHPALPVIAQIARKDVAWLSPETTLNQLGLNSSLGLSVLRSGLNRRIGCALGPLSWQWTIGELLAAVGGSAIPATTASLKNVPVAGRPAASGPFGGRRHAAPAQALPLHGVDIEDIATMPPWPPAGEGKAFYDEHFAPAELAHAARRASPTATLCGIWCAKEAVRKCAAELGALGWREIEIAVGADGRPEVRLTTPEAIGRWEFSLSISHSAASAAASVLALRRGER